MITMSMRMCKTCHLLKNDDDFYAGKLACKKCFNESRKSARKTISDKVNMNVVSLVKQFQELITHYCVDGSRIDELVKINTLLGKQFSEIQNDIPILYITYTISSNAVTYLLKCNDHHLTSYLNIHAMIYDISKTTIFKEMYGIERSDAIYIAPEISNLFDMISALNVAYDYFIDLINDVKFEIDKTTLIPHVKAIYNANTINIEFDNNPLKFTPVVFMLKIKNETQRHPGLMYYHANGKFIQIYQTYNIQ